MRHGIAEQDKGGISEMVDHEPTVAIHRFYKATTKGGDCVTQILEADAVGRLGRSDQFAGHGGDLPTFGVGTRTWRGVRPGVDRWRRDAVRILGDDGGGEAITAARHGLDPAVAAGGFTEDPA